MTSVTPDSVGLAWTVPEGQFDSFLVQYKDREGRPQVLPVEGGLREARVWGLDAARRYKLLLYGLHQGRRVGPLSAFAVTGECGCRTDRPASLQALALSQSPAALGPQEPKGDGGWERLTAP